MRSKTLLLPTVFARGIQTNKPNFNNYSMNQQCMLSSYFLIQFIDNLGSANWLQWSCTPAFTKKPKERLILK